MTFDPEARALRFGSDEEVERFHTELSTLLRSMLVASTKHLEDGQAAKEASREVFRQNAAVLRALNALRRHLVRHGS